MPAVEEPLRLEARLLLVSNRLPITISREDGGFKYQMSAGGLVSGLSGLSKSTTFQWYGWPGLETSAEESKELTTRLRDDYNAVPVFISDELADKHYNGFSSPPILYRLFLQNRLTFSRLHSLATLSLPPRRDHVRRGGMECIHRSQPPVR